MNKPPGTGFGRLSGRCAFAPSGDWDSGNPAFAISRGSPDAPLSTPGTTAGFLACYFPRSPFRTTGQPSDPETSPLVPARYASDTTLRLVAQLQRAATTSSPPAAPTTSGIACPPARLWQNPAPTGPRRPAQRVRPRGLKPLIRDRGRV